MKTILGKEIPTVTRGILYLCEYKYQPPSIEVMAEALFMESWQALDAYASIPNPESQLVTGKTYKQLIENLELLHKNLTNPVWVKELAEYL